MTTPKKFWRWTNPITTHSSYTFINSASHILGTRGTTQRTDAIILLLTEYEQGTVKQRGKTMTSFKRKIKKNWQNGRLLSRPLRSPLGLSSSMTYFRPKYTPFRLKKLLQNKQKWMERPFISPSVYSKWGETVVTMYHLQIIAPPPLHESTSI
jgi:hypothetical protein